MMRLFTLAVIGVTLAAPQTSGDGRDGPRPVAGVVGKFKVEFASGVTEECQISRDGKVRVVEPLRNASGQAEAKGNSFVVTFLDDRVERWTPVGKRFVVEHW